MLSLFCLFKVKLSSSSYDLHLEVDILFKALFKGKHLGYAVYKGKHDDSHCVLELGIRKQLIENHLWVGILFELDNDTHTVLAGFVVKVMYTVDPLVLYKVCDRNTQSCLVYHVRYLGDDNAVSAVYLLDRGL